MRSFIVALLISSLAAAGDPTLEWLPLPSSISWHGDHAAPVGAGFVGRAIAIVVVDWQRAEGGAIGPGQQTYWHLRWSWTEKGMNGRYGAMALSVVGSLPRQDQDRIEKFAKGQDNSGGLLRALGGDASAVVMLVNDEGRVTRIARCFNEESFSAQFTALVPKEDLSLFKDEGQYPVACKPVFALLAVGDIKGALAMCSKKLGADGMALAKDITTQAGVVCDRELARFADPSLSAAQRFIAQGRLTDVLAVFPNTAKAGEMAKVAKSLKGDKTYAAEVAGWAAFQDYLAQMGKVQPKKAVELQKQLLKAIETKYPDTYAAELVGMIRSAAQLAE